MRMTIDGTKDLETERHSNNYKDVSLPGSWPEKPSARSEPGTSHRHGQLSSRTHERVYFALQSPGRQHPQSFQISAHQHVSNRLASGHPSRVKGAHANNGSLGEVRCLYPRARCEPDSALELRSDRKLKSTVDRSSLVCPGGSGRLSGRSGDYSSFHPKLRPQMFSNQGRVVEP